MVGVAVAFVVGVILGGTATYIGHWYSAVSRNIEQIDDQLDETRRWIGVQKRLCSPYLFMPNSVSALLSQDHSKLRVALATYEMSVSDSNQKQVGNEQAFIDSALVCRALEGIESELRNLD